MSWIIQLQERPYFVELYFSRNMFFVWYVQSQNDSLKVSDDERMWGEWLKEEEKHSTLGSLTQVYKLIRKNHIHLAQLLLPGVIKPITTHMKQVFLRKVRKKCYLLEKRSFAKSTFGSVLQIFRSPRLKNPSEAYFTFKLSALHYRDWKAVFLHDDYNISLSWHQSH